MHDSFVTISLVANASNTTPVAMFGGGPEHAGVYETKPVETLHGVKWTFTANTEASGIPLVHDGVVYFATVGGYMYAVDAEDGRADGQYDGKVV